MPDTHPSPVHVARRSRPDIHRRRWLTVLTAMAAATAGCAIARQVADVDLAVRLGGTVRQVEPGAAMLTALAVGFAAWALLAILERRTPAARTVWTVAACAVFLVSLAGPLAAVTPAATVALLILHGVVAGILIVGLRRTVPPR